MPVVTKGSRNPTSNQRKTRVRLTNEQKAELCDKARMTPNFNQEELGKWAQTKFSLAEPLGQTTVSKILLESDKIYERLINGEGDRKSSKKTKFPGLDQDIEKFILDMNERKEPVNRDAVMVYAKITASKKYKMNELPQKDRLTFSDGWLTDVFK